MYKKLLTIAVFLLAGCDVPNNKAAQYSDAQSYYKAGYELIHCTSSNNIPKELLFYTINRETSLIANSPDDTLMVYYISDVKGDFYAINSDELTNYKCASVAPKVQ